MRRSGKKGISVSSLLAILLTISVVVSLVVVFRSIGGPLDLSQVLTAFSDSTHKESSDAGPVQFSAPPVQQAAAIPTLAPASPSGGSFSLTAAGSLYLAGDVRRSGYYSDVKAYDFSELLSLVQQEIPADLSLITLENLVDPSSKVSDLIAPKEIFSALKSAGFSTVSVAFPKAMDRGVAALASTVSAATDAKLQVSGTSLSGSTSILELNGVRVALLSYTDNLTSTGKKKLKQETTGNILPSTEQAAADITAARQAGAKVIIVSVSWGNTGKSSVTSSQRSAAQALADAGADIILGTGTRVIQPASWLERESGGQTLCFYSLGALLCDDRSNSQVAGMLLHLNISVSGSGNVSIDDIACTPTFIWRYKQDNAYRYRVVASSHTPPAGMENNQQSAMERALSTVRTALGTEVDLAIR